MAVLVWDQTGDRIYQTGVDRGILYLHDGVVTPWNGLISIDESSAQELKTFYLDGVKYLENLTPGDFLGKLKAFTYPDEFDLVNGIAEVAPGLSFYEQPSKSFSMSYRTKIGNDFDGNLGYKIHILYNVIANPESHSFGTDTDSGIQAVEFGWNLTGTPTLINNFRPTVHVSIDSRTTPSDILTMIEAILYGTPTTEPFLPSIRDLAGYFGYLGALIIVDVGDGTWIAIDNSNTYITMLDSTTFQIEHADATYLDADTYTISSTNTSGEI